MDFRTPVSLERSQTKRVTILDTQTTSDEAVFDSEYTIFKIAVIDGTGLAGGVDVNLLVNGNPLYVDGAEVDFSPAAGEWVWVVDAKAGINNLSIFLGAVTTDDVVFQITGYRAAA